METSLLQNRYRLDAELAQGGMGVLYRAHDLLLERDVAIKLLKDSGLGSQGRARLLHEAQAAARLDHPNIVTVYDVGEEAGRPYIVMQLIEGQSLHEQRPSSLAGILAIARQVCAALEHAHRHGIIHRDLKPENILLTPEGVAKLSDFGLARSAASRLSSEGMLVGTVFYMAPEQALGGEVDGRTDLYALGVLLYELTAGRLPFIADDPISVISQHLYAPVVPASTYNQQIPAALDALILALLSKRPADRPASAAETLDLLERVPLESGEAGGPAPSSAGLSLLGRIARGRLVGRQAELKQLQELWAYTQQGQAHLALISGEPGIGKTRLANELIVFTQLNHAAVLRAGCYELEAASPYLPFADALRAWVAEQNTPHLRERLASTAFELARLAPEIETRLGPLPPSPSLPANEERLRMFDSLAGLFQDLARDHGLLLFIDDLHWADNGTLSLLHYLLRRLRHERLLILAAYREVELERSRPLTDALVEWNRARLATRLALGRLSQAQCQSLLAGLFGQESISDEFNQIIFNETEGNPFFIEEVVKALIEQGQIYREGDTWQRKEIAELTIPQSVKEAIGRRLNRLSPACLETLHLAATAGKSFEFSELAAVTEGGEETLLDRLDEAETAQLIRSTPPETYTFTHDKIREVLYDEINPIRRRRLHQRLGEGLLKLHAADLERHAQELAYHFIESGDLERGLEFAIQAARQAARIYAHDEALLYYARAAECAEGLGRPEQQAAIEEAAGDLYHRVGPFERAIEYYQRALERLDSPARRAELGAKIGATYTNIGDERGAAYLRANLETLDPLTQVEARARVLGMLGRFHHYHGQPEQAILYLEEARQLAEPLDNPDLVTDIYAYLTGAFQWSNDFDASNEWARRTLDYGRRHNFPHAMALGYEFLAENAFNTGQWRVALENAARDAEIGEKIGSHDRVGWSTLSCAYAYQGLGELSLSLAAANRGVELAQSIGNTRLEVILRAKRATVASWMGDAALSEADLAFLRPAAERARQFQFYDWTYQAIGQIHEYHELWDELLTTVEQLEELTGRGYPGYAVSAYIGLGRLEDVRRLLTQGEWLPAEDEISLAAGYLWRGFGRLQALQGELEIAYRSLTRSIAIFEKLESRLEIARTLLFRSRVLLVLAREAEAHQDEQAAFERFSECGAVIPIGYQPLQER